MYTDKIIEKLKSKGVKVTPQRLEIIEFLEHNLNHPTSEMIYEAVKEKYPTVSLATVYNTIDMLESIGEIVKVQIANDNKVRVDYRKEFHHHFECRICGCITDIELCCDRVEFLRRDGYQVEEMHGYFKGVCKVCAKSSV